MKLNNCPALHSLRTKVCFLTALLLICIGSCGAAEKPNIVFIIADDLGYNDVGFNGGKEIRTPHLDKLAAAGAVLKQFYVQPLCSPTRAALMTGRYPMRYGLQVGVIRPWADYGLPLEERLLPEALREAGYSTAICGKWHLGSLEKAYQPNARGFDHFYGHLFGQTDYFKHERDGEPDWYRNTERVKEEGYTTHLLAREAVKLIKAQSKDKPLFLYVPFNAVHTPMQVPDEYKEPYAGLPEPRRTLAAMLAAMDEAVGQIVAAIDETGRRSNTLFIFTSDNGGPNPGKVTDNTPLRAGKGSLYEGGVRVCAFATWQGRIKAGSKIEAPLHIVDWFPTLAQLTGASLQQKLPLDGKDMWPTLTAGKPSPHTDILLNATPGKGAIRAGDWKLVLNELQSQSANETPNSESTGKKKDRGAGNVELFDLRQDPGEQNDLAAKHPEKVEELRGRYEALAKHAVPPKGSPPGAEDDRGNKGGKQR